MTLEHTRHLASLHALADAYAATGRFEAAMHAASRVLALSPNEARASALAILLRMARGEDVDDEALALAVKSNPRWPPMIPAASVSLTVR